jgi:hypothetical protein
MSHLLDALREGFEVYPVVDAVGGTSPEAHRAGLERIVQAGAKPISWVSLACELQRDWGRMETVPDVVDIVLTTRLLRSASLGRGAHESPVRGTTSTDIGEYDVRLKEEIRPRNIRLSTTDGAR